MKTNKGFTLVELLVAILCTTLTLSMIMATFIFLTRTSDKVIGESENLYKIQSVKTYIIHHYQGTLPEPNEYIVSEGIVYHLTNIVVTDSKIETIRFDETDGFIQCKIIYENQIYQFIVGKVV